MMQMFTMTAQNRMKLKNSQCKSMDVEISNLASRDRRHETGELMFSLFTELNQLLHCVTPATSDSLSVASLKSEPI